MRCSATPTWNSSATASAMSSCTGAQQAFDNFRVFPPSSGIIHQVNLEYLATCVLDPPGGRRPLAFPDTLVGTDSHTTMINGLGVVGWGVGGIEAVAAMLGEPIEMVTPDVIGFKLVGALPEGTTPTDLTLTIIQMLRKQGVVDKFVEFFGPGLSSISPTDRAMIANMTPESGATMIYFPVDEHTLHYLTPDRTLARAGRAWWRIITGPSTCSATTAPPTPNIPPCCSST